MPILIPPKAPNLLIAPAAYQAQYHEQMNNALRLYFSRIDSDLAALFGPLGMGYLDAPHISASDSTDQFADGNDDPTIVKWNTAEAVNGFTLNVDNTAQVKVPGIYKIDYSLQFANTDNAQHDVYVWLQENGTQIPNSCSKFTIPARKSAGVYGYAVAYSSIVFAADPEDKIGLWWATSNAASSNLVTAGVYMDHIPAQTVPYPRPANPSSVGSITFLGRLPPTP
jgi:hypothetical protein